MGTNIIYTYQTKIDFPVKEGKGPFNLRSKFSALMNKLLKMEWSIIIGPADGKDSKWASTRELPPEDRFNEVSVMRQETCKDKSHVIVHAKIKTTWKLNGMKGEHGILRYLHQHSIFL
eukprot:403893-Ditylum_brightwellii.AAC.1